MLLMLHVGDREGFTLAPGRNDILDAEGIAAVKLLENVKTATHDDVPTGIGVDPTIMEIIKILPLESKPFARICVGDLLEVFLLRGGIELILGGAQFDRHLILLRFILQDYT